MLVGPRNDHIVADRNAHANQAGCRVVARRYYAGKCDNGCRNDRGTRQASTHCRHSGFAGKLDCDDGSRDSRFAFASGNSRAQYNRITASASRKALQRAHRSCNVDAAPVCRAAANSGKDAAKPSAGPASAGVPFGPTAPTARSHRGQSASAESIREYAFALANSAIAITKYIAHSVSRRPEGHADIFRPARSRRAATAKPHRVALR